MLWRRLQNVLRTSWRCPEDVFKRRLENVLKTSSEDVWLRWTYSYWLRRLEDVLKTLYEGETKDVFKSCSRRLDQDECLLGGKSWCVSNCTLKNTLSDLVAREMNLFRAVHFQEIAGYKAFFHVRVFAFRYLNYIQKTITLKSWILLIQHPISLFFVGFFGLLKQICVFKYVLI